MKALTKLRVVGLYETAVTEAGIAKLKLTLKNTDFDLSAFGKDGSVFKASGCIQKDIANRYFSMDE